MAHGPLVFIVTILNKAIFSEIILNVDTCRYFDIPGIFFPVFQPVISIAKPGEIRKEYEEQLRKVCLNFFAPFNIYIYF